jgi:siroheme synthase (precorrin-2 oxidase/ferrochelatase)
MDKNNNLTLKRFNAKLSSDYGSGLGLKMDKKRATIYFDPNLFKVLRMKAAATERSISDLVNEAVRRAFLDDFVDLRAFEERAAEPLVSFEDVLKKLHKDGKL